MPLHAGKGSTSAAAGFLESNHSLSTNPYLPFFFFFTLVSLPPPPPSSSDHQGLTSTGAQSRGKNTAGEKQTDEKIHWIQINNHLHFLILEQKKRAYLVVFYSEFLSIMESRFCFKNCSRNCGCNVKGYKTLAFVCKALALVVAKNRRLDACYKQLRRTRSQTRCQRCRDDVSTGR